MEEAGFMSQDRSDARRVTADLHPQTGPPPEPGPVTQTSDSNQWRAMVTKKIRTEYMKKFKDPRWETFSKCYEDALKYRLTRRVMEHSHKPWFWEGWEGGSESSGWSTPRLTRNKVSPLSPLSPLSLPPPPASSDLKQRLSELKTGPGPEPPHQEARAGGAGDAAPSTAITAEESVSGGRGYRVTDSQSRPMGAAALVENDVNEAGGGSVKPVPNASPPSEDTGTDAGPADTASSDGEPVNPAPKRRLRRRAPHTDPGRQDSSSDDKQAEVRKAPRAKSQPPVSTKENRRTSSRLDRAEENRRTSSRLDRAENQPEVRTTANDSQSRRESDKRSSNVERRRARSADLDKVRRAQLTVVDDRWMTEYMSCFSARRR
ncbi:unnamed protein product [Pleuronectes platessa]|uniref:Centriole, cilia and spindle-associated protein n=1 Tax=Pleuronectes platessa TaxID=8262 RepID=A0A9N7TL21_PLEPL|nr:unnamed protein product [Pleuronectes platessa]